MNTKTVDIQEAQTQLLQLLALALQGDDLVIAENNVPLVRLVPVQPQPPRRIADLHKGAIRIRADFNQPLSDELAKSFLDVAEALALEGPSDWSVRI